MKKKPTPATQDQPATTTTTVVAPTLAHMREQCLRVRSNAARTIAELEAWRDEIDGTIAFLRAQGGGRR